MKCKLYDRECENCGECEYCELEPSKKCDNCCKCLAFDGDYAAIEVDGFIIETENGPEE